VRIRVLPHIHHPRLYLLVTFISPTKRWNGSIIVRQVLAPGGVFLDLDEPGRIAFMRFE
jgi:hypothetical protein